MWLFKSAYTLSYSPVNTHTRAQAHRCRNKPAAALSLWPGGLKLAGKQEAELRGKIYCYSLIFHLEAKNYADHFSVS